MVKTREKLIEVARQLFAYKGVENTTMSDIASASEKGRRTIYTYFKSKHEIYEATIEQDSDNMVKQLKDAVDQEKTAQSKLRQFMYYRLNLFDKPAPRPRGVNLDSLFYLDFKRIDKVRSKAISKEKEMLYAILDKGVADGSFNMKQTKRFMPVLQMLLQGVDLSVAHNNFEQLDIDKKNYKEDIIEFIIDSLITK
ncbi:MAG: TetR/AcrR family transcriptional regulator [Clostridiales bacterium]|nr:TetR/AcrR family transcriptional regulator [Clostridiales bacterium]